MGSLDDCAPTTQPPKSREALRAGYERMLGWADVLDRINVFPVPDGDTGRNLVLSLAPLRDTSISVSELVKRLLLSARGNSGNIAVEFVRRLVESSGPTRHETNAVPEEKTGGNQSSPGAGDRVTTLGKRHPLTAAFADGAVAARDAVRVPKPGTMLTTFDALVASATLGIARDEIDRILGDVAEAVKATAHGLPELQSAGVVDSGSLGMLLFLDGYLRCLFDLPPDSLLLERFRSFVGTPRLDAVPTHESGCCVDAVLRLRPGQRFEQAKLEAIGSDIVALRDGEFVKVHLHAEDAGAARASLEAFADIVRWSWDDLALQTTSARHVAPQGAVHVVTDAAASIGRAEAEELGISLLDSYVNFEDRSLPETRVSPDEVYLAMRKGNRITTSQASTFERHRHYERIASEWGRALYVTVGSVYTGNFDAANDWAAGQAAEGRIVVVDSGAASGRLAVAIRAVHARARTEADPHVLADYARRVLERAEEYVFLDKLEYLARGGRVAKVNAIFADMLSLAPVISPMPDGARKIAMLRKLEDKLAFACKNVARALKPSQGRGLVLLQYTDNRTWIERELVSRVRDVAPRASCRVVPMSLSSGAHMGPGTWSVAVLAEAEGEPS